MYASSKFANILMKQTYIPLIHHISPIFWSGIFWKSPSALPSEMEPVITQRLSRVASVRASELFLDSVSSIHSGPRIDYETFLDRGRRGWHENRKVVRRFCRVEWAKGVDLGAFEDHRRDIWREISHNGLVISGRGRPNHEQSCD